jgi:hypothetical protein
MLHSCLISPDLYDFIYAFLDIENGEVFLKFLSPITQGIVVQDVMNVMVY